MKIRRFLESLQKVQKTKPKVTQFIFDKYLSDMVEFNDKSVKFRDSDNQEKDLYRIAFKMKKYSLDKGSLDFLSSLMDRLVDFDVPGKKSLSLVVYGDNITISIVLNKSQLKEIKGTDEYRNWYNRLDSSWLEWKKDVELKKDMKKYNL